MWNSHFRRGFPGRFESGNLSRDNVSREIGCGHKFLWDGASRERATGSAHPSRGWQRLNKSSMCATDAVLNPFGQSPDLSRSDLFSYPLSNFFLVRETNPNPKRDNSQSPNVWDLGDFRGRFRLGSGPVSRQSFTPSPLTKSSGFRVFDSSKLLVLRGGNSHVRWIL